MANSIITYPWDGVTTQFPLNFTLGILSRDDVKARVGTEVDGLGDPVYRNLEWVSDGLVNVQGGPGAVVPTTITFTRTVKINELQHSYVNGAMIEAGNLDESNLQAIMLIHQFIDGRIEGGGFNQNLSMNGFKLTDVGAGSNPGDGVNFQQLTDMTGNAPAFAAIAQAAASDAAGYLADIEDEVVAAEDAADRAETAAAMLPLNNFSATTAPTANDDNTEGYSVGSKWVVVSGDPEDLEAWTCLSSATGAAIWELATLTIDDLGSAATQPVAAFATAAQGALADTAVQPGDIVPGLTYVDSGELALNAGGTTQTWTHSIGAAPKISGAYLVCKTADLGLAVGDTLPVRADFNGAGNVQGATVYHTTTAVKANISPNGWLAHSSLITTLGNWRVVFWALY